MTEPEVEDIQNPTAIDNTQVNNINSSSQENGEIIDDLALSSTGTSSGENVDSDFETTKIKEQPFFHTCMNLLNCMLGVGILSVPSSFSSIGIVPSLFLILFICFLSYCASMINVHLVHKITCNGFDELVGIVLGKGWKITYSIIVILFLESSLIAFLIIGGDMIISWFSFAHIDIKQFKYRLIMILIYSLALPVPLMIPKKLTILGYFSAASMFLIVFYIIATIVKSIQILPRFGISKTVIVAKFDMSIFSSLAIYALTFALPCLLIPIIQPFSPIVKKRRNLLIVSCSICAFFVIFPSIFMYLIFGSEADGNILNSFPDNDILFTLVRAGFFFIVTSSFPVVGKSCMSNWGELIFKENLPNNLPRLKYFALIALTVSFPVILAMVLPQCKPVFAIGGALGGCIACFTFPCFCFVKASDKPLSHWSNVLAIIFGIAGIVFAIVSGFQSTIEAIESF